MNGITTQSLVGEGKGEGEMAIRRKDYLTSNPFNPVFSIMNS
jgi:hypothetical protein